MAVKKWEPINGFAKYIGGSQLVRLRSQDQVRQQVQTLTQKHQANLEHLGSNLGFLKRYLHIIYICKDAVPNELEKPLVDPFWQRFY